MRKALIFATAARAIATAQRIAQAKHEVMATQLSPNDFRVYVDGQTYSTSGALLWTNLFDMKAYRASMPNTKESNQ